MLINIVPFLFLPGIAMMGFLLGGQAGAIAATLAWTAIMVLATAVCLVRHIRERRHGQSTLRHRMH